ncbi:MAG: TMEM175 family protein [Coriobacteriales bacterium]|nr:TMEM175 family protein [Coriobacteriales bacterium]
MNKTRLEAFTDAVIAIVITVLVLELVAPESGSVAALWDLRYRFLVYLVSFLTLAIYWNNHHHLFQISRHVSGGVLWCNIVLLLFLSLFPFTTAWVNDHLLDRAPELLYGLTMLCADIVWLVMAKALVKENGHNSEVAKALKGFGKSYLSIATIAVGLLVGWFLPPATIVLCVASLAPWVVPDRRIERMLHEGTARAEGAAHEGGMRTQGPDKADKDG